MICDCELSAVNIFLLLAKIIAYAATGSKAVLASLADSAGKPPFYASSPPCISHCFRVHCAITSQD